MNKDTSNNKVSGTHLWLVLHKAERTLAGEASKSIAGLGICPSDFAVLEVLLHKGPLSVGEIGKKVLLTSGSMTAAVDRLEAKGFVKRTPEPGDRRSIRVHLRPEGKVFIQKLFKEHTRHLEEACSGLSTKEQEKLIQLLKKLGQSLAEKGGNS